jgi:hypothetical protein
MLSIVENIGLVKLTYAIVSPFEKIKHELNIFLVLVNISNFHFSFYTFFYQVLVLPSLGYPKHFKFQSGFLKLLERNLLLYQVLKAPLSKELIWVL